MRDLFFGLGIGHSILLLAVVIATGIWLGRFKIKGVTLGSTWILFVGILLSHFGFRIPGELLHFLKEFGLILFVFSIGLQVGPGFFHSFKKGGLTMNMLAVALVLLAVLTTYVIHLVTGEDLATMVGVMSGAVTNTPGLGAAQQTYYDATVVTQGAEAASGLSGSLASGYAVAYPLGVLGVILVIMLVKGLFRIDLKKEAAALDQDNSGIESAVRLVFEAENPAVCGKEIKDGIYEVDIRNQIKPDGLEFIGPDIPLLSGENITLLNEEMEETEKLDHGHTGYIKTTLPLKEGYIIRCLSSSPIVK